MNLQGHTILGLCKAFSIANAAMLHKSLLKVLSNITTQLYLYSLRIHFKTDNSLTK